MSRKTSDTSFDTKHVELCVDSARALGQRDGQHVSCGTPPTMTKAKRLACFALCMSYTTALQQNACTAFIVKQIDDELGPTTYYNWIISAYAIAVAVVGPLSGGLSDIFGRRWFFIVGTLFSLIGTVVALCAQNVVTVIVGMTLEGMGAGSQILSLAAISELVPNKKRGVAQVVLDLVAFPWAVFGALIGNAMVKYTKLSFRINFIIGIGLNIITLVVIYLWYHPPSAPRLPRDRTKLERLLQIDWTGAFLMSTAVVLILIGLALGGTEFEWGSTGNVIILFIGPCAFIAMIFWEWKVAENPLFAHELFRDRSRTFTLMLVVTFVSGMSFFTGETFWMQECQAMWVRDPIGIGLSRIPVGAGAAVGGLVGGLVVGRRGARRGSSRGCVFGVPRLLLFANLIKLGADLTFIHFTPDSFHLALGMGFLANFGTGMSLVVLVVGVQLACEDANIGLATLILGSIRFIGGSVAVTVYTSILQNTMAGDVGPRVAKAVSSFGVPQEAVPDLIALLMAGKAEAAGQIPGFSPEAVEAASEAIKWSSAKGFSNVYIAAACFSGIGIVCCLLMKDVSHNMTDSVAVTLKNDGQREEPKRTWASRHVPV